MKPTDFAYCLTDYLSKYLPGQIGVSTNTIKSYRDTFTLLLQFFAQEHGISAEKLTLSKIRKDHIENFLLYLENERGCSISTRNQRLAAIHAFFRYLQTEMPQYIYDFQQILGVGFKKQPKSNNIRHIDLDEMQKVLALPDVKTRNGRRDVAMLSLLYDTGACIQELADICVDDVRVEPPSTVRLHGKGGKWRIVPLMPETAAVLQAYLKECKLTSPEKKLSSLFTNRQKQKLTTAGIRYVFNKYVEQCPVKVTPHMFRHSKAMHLLQAGVNIIYIRDVLGHSEISTTQKYARADIEMKRKALEKAYPSPTPSGLPSWQQDDGLLTWLKGLGK